MISFPVDEAHLTASRHPTMDGKMFEVTTTANQAKRYVQGSLCLCVCASALLVSSSGLSYIPCHHRTALVWLATPYISIVGHSVPKTRLKGRRRHFRRVPVDGS
jgi:hypothetical protein